MCKDRVLLYVEDEQSIKEEMVEILQLKFENIHICSNGLEGLQSYKEHNQDLIISDVQMPIMDGITMAKEIKLLNPQAKIILTTAFNEDTFMSNAKALGIKEYVSKPVNINELFKSIQRCFDRDKNKDD